MPFPVKRFPQELPHSSHKIARLSLGAIAVATFLILGQHRQPAQAEITQAEITQAEVAQVRANQVELSQPITPQITVQLPIHTQLNSRQLVLQAEALVAETLYRRFRQNSNLSSLQVVILGDRQGQVVPILTTTVSRSDWQRYPHVNAWSTYNSAFHALLYRPDETTQVATNHRTPARPRSTPQISEQTVVQIERAYDAGRLTRQQVNDFVDILD